MSNIIRSFIVRTGVDMSGMTVGLSRLSSDLKRAGKQITATGQSLTRNLTVPLLAIGGLAIKSAIDFESAFAGVKKTVEGTEEQLEGIKQGIIDMSEKLPASTEEISKVAEAAGQLGIKTEDILDFTRVMVDLGNTTNLSADVAATQLARLANITGMASEDYSRLGSTIVALGNNMATTEAEISEMALRLAGAGKQVGMTEPQILGLAAALSSVGIEAQAGGSAMSKVMVEIQLAVAKGGESLEQFADVAGMSADDFKESFKKDAAGAIVSFINGLGNMSKEGKDAIVVLDDMGITEVRMRDALLRAANAGTLFNDAIEIGTEAWDENTAMTDEANKRYETMESQLKIALNSLKNVGIELGQKLMPIVKDGIIPAIKGFAEWIGKLIDRFNSLSPFMRDMVTLALGIAVAIGPLTTIVGKLIITMGSLVKSFQLAQMALAGGSGFMGAITTFLGPAGTVVIAIAAIAAIVGTLVIAFNNANAETKALKKEIQDFNDEVNQSKETFDGLIEKNQVSAGAAKALADELYNLADQENKSTVEKMRMKDIVDQLNTMYEGLNLTIDEITGTLSLEKEAIEDVIDANLKQLQLSAYSNRLTELYEEQYEAARKLSDITNTMTDGLISAAESVKTGAFYQKLYNEAMEDGVITTDEYNSMNRKLTSNVGDTVAAYLMASMVQDQNTEAINGATEAYGVLSKEISDSSSTIQDATEKTGIAWEDLSDTQKAALESMGTAQQDYTEMSEEDLQAYMDEMQAQQEEYEKLLDERMAVTQNAFEKIESTIDLSLNEMIDNLESNQELVDKWTDDLAILTEKGLNEGFIQVLEDTGVDAAATVANLVDASDEEIQRLNDVFMNGSTVAIESMQKELGLSTTVNAGSDAISDIADGVENNKELTDAVTQQAKDAKAAMITQVAKSNFSTVGSSMIQGTINGMNGLKGNLDSTARSLARSAYDSMRRELNMHSPSKKTAEIGRFFVSGLINGIGELSHNAVNKAKELSSNIVNALSFDAIQFPSMPDFDALHSSAMQTSGLSSAIQNTTNTSSRETNVKVEFTGPIMLGNEMDIEKVATMLGYYTQEKLAAQGA
jgi:TP901 family phage tail tape measure protein